MPYPRRNPTPSIQNLSSTRAQASVTSWASPSACPPRSCTSSPARPDSQTTSTPRASRLWSSASRSPRTCRAAAPVLRRRGRAVDRRSRGRPRSAFCCSGRTPCRRTMFSYGPRTGRPCSVPNFSPTRVCAPPRSGSRIRGSSPLFPPRRFCARPRGAGRPCWILSDSVLGRGGFQCRSSWALAMRSHGCWFRWCNDRWGGGYDRCLRA